MAVETAEPTITQLPDRKEEQILDASRALFLELGYADTSMDLVAQRARVSKTTLYTRFPSKEALFAATIKSECQRRMPMDAGALAGLPIDEALRSIARQFIELVSSPEAVRVEQMVTAEAGRFPELAETFLREGPYRVKAMVADFFARAAERGFLVVDDPLFVATQFLMSLKGAPHCELVLGRPRPQRRARQRGLHREGRRPLPLRRPPTLTAQFCRHPLPDVA
jgi:TetR/AcrR family transcriptional repressor of mexJK operon